MHDELIGGGGGGGWFTWCVSEPRVGARLMELFVHSIYVCALFSSVLGARRSSRFFLSLRFSEVSTYVSEHRLTEETVVAGYFFLRTMLRK